MFGKPMRITFRERKARFLSWLLEDRALEGLGGAPNGFRYSRKFTSRGHGSSNSVENFGMHFGNDAFDVMIYRKFRGEKSRWALFIAAEDFRKLALWYLWRWAWGEWFGLRRHLFYWNLNREIQKQKAIRALEPDEEATGE